MRKLHEFLEARVSWYQSWHQAPLSHVLHWATFVVLAILFINFVSSVQVEINKSSAYNETSAANILKRKGGVVQDQILVKFKDNIEKSKKDQVLAKHGLSEKSEIAQIKVKVVSISQNDTPQEVVDRLNSQEKDTIEFAEVDAIIYPDYVPNDPQYGTNWQLPKMSAPAAWDVTTGNSSVVIAILDTGTNCNHEDLVSRCVPGWNTYSNTADTSDTHGHGTATAGTAAAIGDNGVGIASPCYNCKIMPVKIAGPTGSSTTSVIVTAITYAADHGAKIANISYGPLGGVGGMVSNAAQYFMSKGGIVIISAGNTSANNTNPDDPNMISVSGVDQGDMLYGWSNYGTDTDLAAAGCVNTTNYTGGYVGKCGTSFAAPTVAGVAGLIFSKNPSLSGAQVRNILKSNTNDIYTSGFDIYSGFGTPNMLSAVNAAGAGPVPDVTPPSTPTLSGSAAAPTRVDLSWTASSDDIGVVGYDVYRNGSKISNVVGTGLTDATASPSTTYSYYVTAVDLAGNNSAPSNTISVTTPTQAANVTITNQQVTNKTGTTATITWTTNVNSTGTISYGKSASALTSTATDSVVGKTHTVKLTGLTGLTTYYYKITAASSPASSTAVGVVSSFKTPKK